MSAEVQFDHEPPDRSAQVRMMSGFHAVINAENVARRRAHLSEITLSTLDPSHERPLADAARIFVAQTVDRSIDEANPAHNPKLAQAYRQGRIALLHTVSGPDVVSKSLDEYYRLRATAEPATVMAYRAHYEHQARQQLARFPEIALGTQLSAALHAPQYYSVARVAANAASALLTAYGHSLDRLHERDHHGIIRRFDIPKGQ